MLNTNSKTFRSAKKEGDEIGRGGGESSRITIIVILLSAKHPLDMDALIAGMPLTASDVFKPGQSPKCRFFDKVFESLSLTIDHLM